MPPAVVQSTSTNYAAGPTSLAYPSNITANNLLLVMIGGDATSAFTVSDTKTNTWTEVGHNNTATGAVGIFWAVANGSGADTVTLTSTLSNVMGLIYEVSGCATTTPVDQSGTTSSNTSVPVLGVAFTGLSSTTDLIVQWAIYNPPGNNPVGGIWTSDYSALIAGGHYTGMAYAVSGTTVAAPTIDSGINSAYTLSAAAFKPGATGPVTGTASLPLGPITLSTTGTATWTATSTLALGPITLTASSTSIATGTSVLSLGPITLTTTSLATGTVTIALGPVRLVATIFGAFITIGPITTTVTSSTDAGGGTLSDMRGVSSIPSLIPVVSGGSSAYGIRTH